MIYLLCALCSIAFASWENCKGKILWHGTQVAPGGFDDCKVYPSLETPYGNHFLAGLQAWADDVLNINKGLFWDQVLTDDHWKFMPEEAQEVHDRQSLCLRLKLLSTSKNIPGGYLNEDESEILPTWFTFDARKDIAKKAGMRGADSVYLHQYRVKDGNILRARSFLDLVKKMIDIGNKISFSDSFKLKTLKKKLETDGMQHGVDDFGIGMKVATLFGKLSKEVNMKKLQPHDKVRILGLESEEGKLLNGQEGVLISQKQNGRWGVRFSDGREKSIKAVNVEKITSSPEENAIGYVIEHGFQSWRDNAGLKYNMFDMTRLTNYLPGEEVTLVDSQRDLEYIGHEKIKAACRMCS